jgi:hypothetical protein
MSSSSSGIARIGPGESLNSGVNYGLSTPRAVTEIVDDWSQEGFGIGLLRV